MARRGRHPRRGGRTTPPGTRTIGQRWNAGATLDEPDLVRDVRARVDAGPVAVLELASSMIERCTPRPLDAIAPPEHGRMDAEELLRTFIEAPFPVMRTLAAAMLPLLGDRELASRMRARLLLVDDRSPAWLHTIDRPTTVGGTAMVDPLGDGDNMIVGMQWPSGHAGTLVVYIDHNLGTRVKDAFVLPLTFDDVLEQFSNVSDGSAAFDELSLANVSARMQEALDRGDRMVPLLTSDGWPDLRPFVGWLLERLPSGGAGYPHAEWSPRQIDDLADSFARSRFAETLELDRRVVRDLVEPMLWLACTTTPGDPMRWSPVLVEIALADWLPRKVRAPRTHLHRVPDVLAVLVKYAHHARGVTPDLTAETLRAVELWTPEYFAAIEGPRTSPAQEAARIARIAAGLDVEGDTAERRDDEELDDVHERDWFAFVDEMEARLIEAIGGPAAVEALELTPLPDEPFDWTSVADDLRDRVAEVLALVDAMCEHLLDIEMRTICRRHLATIVREDPDVFRRSKRMDLIAGGLIWAAIVIHLPAHEVRDFIEVPTRKGLAEAMSVNPSSLGQRASLIRGQLGRGAGAAGVGGWHSARRRAWRRRLDSITEWRRGLPRMS